jgi:hypothetical protein
VRDRYDDGKKKKVQFICLAGARLILRPEKNKFKSPVWRVCDRYYELKKKSFSHLSGRCVTAITTGKKSSSRLSGGCTIVITSGKK